MNESQSNRLLRALKGGRKYSVPELIEKVYGMDKPTSARLAARIHDLRKKGYEIESGQKKKGSPIWWYRLINEPKTKFE